MPPVLRTNESQQNVIDENDFMKKIFLQIDLDIIPFSKELTLVTTMWSKFMIVIDVRPAPLFN